MTNTTTAPLSDDELVAGRKERSQRLYIELFGKGNVNVAHEIMAPGIVSHFPDGTTTSGEGGIIRQALFLRRAMPDLKVTCEEQVAEGDRVTTRWSATGTHTGPLTLPGSTGQPTGHALTFREIRSDRYDGDTIVESWLISDQYAAWPQVRLIT